MNLNKFWMVKSSHEGATQVKHYSKKEAVAEATRLARMHPQREFFVLAATEAYTLKKELVPVIRVDVYEN